METFAWPASMPVSAPSTKVAVLLPGSGYKVEFPLLYWPAQMLAGLGWHVQAVRWTDDDEPAPDPHGFAAHVAEYAFAQAPEAAIRLVVAKSFGSLAIPWAEAAGIPAVWLTPLLTDPAVRASVLGSSKEDLFIGGSLDTLWNPAGLGGAAGTFVEIPGTGHSLEVAGDWRASLAAQAQVFNHVRDFVNNLG